MERRLMATLKAELIRAALHTVVSGVGGLQVTRNAPLTEFEGATTMATLADGDVALTEEFLNPPIYEFTARPSLFVVMKWTGSTSPDAELASVLEAFATAIEAAGDLGGLVTAIRVEAPDFAPRELFGAANMKGAQLIVELDYWSDSSFG
jgi:hypothetical protein